EAGKMSRRPKRTAVHLGEAKFRAFRRDEDIAISSEPDAASDAESVHGRDDRHRTFIDCLERFVAALIGAEKRVETFGLLHLLDVDARVKATPLVAKDQRDHRGIASELMDDARELKPARHGERVHGRIITDDLGDPIVDAIGDAHAQLAFSWFSAGLGAQLERSLRKEVWTLVEHVSFSRQGPPAIASSNLGAAAPP